MLSISTCGTTILSQLNSIPDAENTGPTAPPERLQRARLRRALAGAGVRVAVKLSEQGHFTWKEWAEELAAELKAAEDRGEPDDGTLLL
jgi:hypothetical protein